MLEINTHDNPSNLISLSHASRLSGYHQDYLGQLCRAGKLPASKVGRNWFTSKEAVQNLNTPLVELAITESDDEKNDFVDGALYRNSLNEAQDIETNQPVVAQSITISKVDGIPIAIQTIRSPIRANSNLQNVITNMRMQSLQKEVIELRKLLNRLMTEVAAHAKILQEQSARQSRQGSFQQSYVPNIDFRLPEDRYQSEFLETTVAPHLAVNTEEDWDVGIGRKPSFPYMTWIVATASLVLLVYVTVGIFSGSFLKDNGAEVSTLYYHHISQPMVAGASIQPAEEGHLLPTGPSSSYSQNMIQ